MFKRKAKCLSSHYPPSSKDKAYLLTSPVPMRWTTGQQFGKQRSADTWEQSPIGSLVSKQKEMKFKGNKSLVGVPEWRNRENLRGNTRK
jgi:hypothetical protein